MKIDRIRMKILCSTYEMFFICFRRVYDVHRQTEWTCVHCRLLTRRAIHYLSASTLKINYGCSYGTEEVGVASVRSFVYVMSTIISDLNLHGLQCFGLVLHKRTNLLTSVSQLASVLSMLSAASWTLGLAIGSIFQAGDSAMAIGPALMVVYVIDGAR